MQLLLYVYLMSIPDMAVGSFESMRGVIFPAPLLQFLDSNRVNVSANICGALVGWGGSDRPQFRRPCLSKTYTLSLPLSAKFNVPTLILLCTKKVRKEKRISSKVIMVSYLMLSVFGSTLTIYFLNAF